jgi:pimeloyl-ACP methyl ester carboxylesterase
MPGHRPPWIRQYQLLARLPGGMVLFQSIVASRRLRRSAIAFGGCFKDLDLIDGEFYDEFLAPLITSRERLARALRFLVYMRFGPLDRFRELHGTLSMPVAFIWGADDPTFPEPAARAMASQFPNVASFTSVPRAKLFFYEEQPELVAGLVGESVSPPNGTAG